MNQHEFVEKCLERYERLDIIPGDPNEGKWNKAHYPAPNPEGDTTIPMLWDDHQQQGLYQSEEWGRVCFFAGDAKKFLTHGPFVENWFELWDIYDKWMKKKGEGMNEKIHEEKDEEGKSVHAVKLGKKMNEKVHEEKNEEGKSVFAVKNGKKAHEEKNEEGKSVRALKMLEKLHEEKNEEGKSVIAVKAGKKGHEEKDEEGKSVHAVKAAKKSHEERNEEGKSVRALKMLEKLHEEKNEEGKSVVAVKNGKNIGKKTSAQRWQNTHPDWPPFVTNPGALSCWQKKRGIPTEFRIRLNTETLGKVEGVEN